MLNFTETQKEQVRILSDYLKYADLTELEKQTLENKVMDKLKGTTPQQSAIDAMIQQMEFLDSENGYLRAQVGDLEADLQQVLRYLKASKDAHLNNGFELDSVCSKRGVY